MTCARHALKGLLFAALTASTMGVAAGADPPPATQASYERALTDLHAVLGRRYPSFKLKGIDWKKVGEKLLPRAAQVKTDEQFGLLVMEMVARLEDSHAYVLAGSAKPPAPAFARFDPGLACLIDDRGKPVVYHVDKDSPAEKAGVTIGMTIVSVNDVSAERALTDAMAGLSRYRGYSSKRYLRYHAARFFLRQMAQGAPVQLTVKPIDGPKRTLKLSADLGVRYLPRLPVPIAGIRDSAHVAWKRLPNNIGYIRVRRIRPGLIASLDKAVGELQNAWVLIIDVRGNSGGGFDGRRAFRNFALNDPAEPDRPRFQGPMALLIDERCISAGEGWASWFIAKKRARVFGTATAGASGRKINYPLINGLYTVRFPVKAYRGFLRRPIERRGLEPDVKVRHNAKDLAAGRDAVLQAARTYLMQPQPETAPAD